MKAFKVVVAVCLVLVPVLSHAKGVWDVLYGEQGMQQMQALSPVGVTPVVKAVAFGGKVDFQTSNGTEGAGEIGVEVADTGHCTIGDKLCASLKVPLSIKSNDAQTSWKMGANIRGYSYVGLDFLVPFATVGVGYVDANNATASVYVLAGGGIAIPFGTVLKAHPVLEVEYDFSRADNNIYLSHKEKKPYDNQILYSLKFQWN